MPHLRKCIAYSSIHVPNVGGLECVPGQQYDMEAVLGVVDGRALRVGDHIREDCFEAEAEDTSSEPADSSSEEM